VGTIKINKIKKPVEWKHRKDVASLKDYEIMMEQPKKVKTRLED